MLAATLSPFLAADLLVQITGITAVLIGLRLLFGSMLGVLLVHTAIAVVLVAAQGVEISPAAVVTLVSAPLLAFLVPST